MTNDGEYALQVIAPYRKKLRKGDLFAMKFDNSFYVFGRIISTEAFWSPSGKDVGLANLIYIYDQVSSELDGFDRTKLTVSHLLAPPMMVNDIGWRRGYFSTIENIPLEDDQVLERHVFSSSGHRYYDDAGNEVAPWDGPTGIYGAGSYSAVQLVVLHALKLDRPESE